MDCAGKHKAVVSALILLHNAFRALVLQCACRLLARSESLLVIDDDKTAAITETDVQSLDLIIIFLPETDIIQRNPGVKRASISH
jgi:hypothetical protein